MFVFMIVSSSVVTHGKIGVRPQGAHLAHLFVLDQRNAN